MSTYDIGVCVYIYIYVHSRICKHTSKILTSSFDVAAFEWQGFYLELQRVLPHVRKWVEGPPTELGSLRSRKRVHNGRQGEVCVLEHPDLSRSFGSG